ncbi:hypothetical protein B0H17DRAFT_1130189 [Mycena rosella]|uniref:Uncharacterized protein n=1 Tax=Mycena rosella TaxID=1033263 RepID=A0AAD7DRB3_MYCRO|nr:hypothetical protein B0H17DRAFT_1130189 [Mycena rosella]
MATPMPARRDCNAPTFDSAKPHELCRYFANIKFLFDRAAVSDSSEKKKHATRFLVVEDQETWETLPVFTNITKMYDQFKTDVLKLYSGNDEERCFGVSNLDALLGHYSRTGIYSKADLTTFYRQFLRITTYLISKARISAPEQSRAFLGAMQPASLLTKVEQYLQIKKPDIHPEDPYKIIDIYYAAHFVLAGSIVVGHVCTPAGHIPDEKHVAKIVNWGPCKDLSELCTFLGTIRIIRIFIRNFSIAHTPLSSSHAKRCHCDLAPCRSQLKKT